MAETRTSFSYTDEKGEKHVVYAIAEVPKRFVRSMEVVGGEAPRPGESAAADPGGGAKPGAPGQSETISPFFVLLVVFAVLWFKFKNFVVRCILASLLGMSGYYYLFNFTNEEQGAIVDKRPKSFIRLQYDKLTRPMRWKDYSEQEEKRRAERAREEVRKEMRGDKAAGDAKP